jgi:hypothetical protein
MEENSLRIGVPVLIAVAVRDDQIRQLLHHRLRSFIHEVQCGSVIWLLELVFRCQSATVSMGVSSLLSERSSRRIPQKPASIPKQNVQQLKQGKSYLLRESTAIDSDDNPGVRQQHIWLLESTHVLIPDVCKPQVQGTQASCISAPHSLLRRNGRLLRVSHFATSGCLPQGKAHPLRSLRYSGIRKS